VVPRLWALRDSTHVPEPVPLRPTRKTSEGEPKLAWRTSPPISPGQKGPCGAGEIGSAALHGGYYPKSGYDAALQRMTRRAKSRLSRCKKVWVKARHATPTGIGCQPSRRRSPGQRVQVSKIAHRLAEWILPVESQCRLDSACVQLLPHLAPQEVPEAVTDAAKTDENTSR